MVTDSWGELGPNMESAPSPWLADDALTDDARAVLNWLCQSPRPLDRYAASALAVVVFKHQAGTATDAQERAWTALECLRMAGYVNGPASPQASDPMWQLAWKLWARPSGGESITLGEVE